MAYNKSSAFYDAASRISADDIFDHAGAWSRCESKVGERVIVLYEKVIDGKRVAVESEYDSLTYEESPFLTFVKGGPISIPLHKFDVIRELIFGGDHLEAAVWVTSNAAKRQSWLAFMGDYIQATEGILAPSFDEGAYVSEMAASQKMNMKAAELARAALAEDAYAREGETPEPLSADEWLSEPDAETEYRMQDVWVKAATVFVVAPNKTGKTTLVCNVIRSLADGADFLGRYETLPVMRNVGVINFELNGNQYKKWLRKLELANPSKVKVWNLKGKPNPFRTPTSRQHFVKQLKSRQVEVLIVDPFSSAFTGDDANKNEAVKQFLLDLDVLVTEADVEELMMVVHAGHDGTRARGASTLADHPDTSWFLNKNELTQVRTFRAEGRDVFVAEETLEMQTDGITYRLSGLSKAESNVEILKSQVFAFVTTHPDCTASDIEVGVKGKNAAVTSARNSLVAERRLIEVVSGAAKRYKVTP